MARRLFTLLSALSLLLFAAAVVLWVRSYWYADSLGVHLGRTNVHFLSFLGRTRLDSSSYDRAPRDGTGVVWSCMRREDVFTWAEPRRLNVRIGGEPYQGLVWVTPLLRVEALHVILVVLTILLPAAHFGRRMLTRRRPRGALLCRFCGYDLRATPGRCPECGTAAPISERAT